MRMHRGSSKEAGEDLPPRKLSPSAPPTEALLVLDVEIVRASRSERRRIELPADRTVRDVVRAVGLYAAGSAVLIDGRPVPHDRPIAGLHRLQIVPTFSGG